MLGQGIYTLAEVAQYTHVPSATLRSWFMPRADGKGRGPIFASEWERAGDDFAVSFLNLVEAFVASFFKKNKVKPPIIRRAHEILKEQLHTPYPFAHADLETEFGRIIEARQSPGDRHFVDVISQQLVFPQFRHGIAMLDYDQSTRLAGSWRIADGVTINPKISFGKPALKDMGISTLILANQFAANGKSAEIVGRLFKISPGSVLNAVEFERGLKRIAA